MSYELLTGDCRDVLAGLAADSVDAVVCDPPYHIAFMGRSWDAATAGVAFDPATWAAVLKVARPGAWLLAAGSPRTYHRLACAVEDGGWVITDCLHHIHSQGFPKGQGQLKPAYEPWTLARKPAARVAPLNIEACRVVSSGPHGTHGRSKFDGFERHTDGFLSELGGTKTPENPAGRWPPNLLLTHDEQCVPSGVRRVKGSNAASRGGKTFGGDSAYAYEPGMVLGYADPDGYETVADTSGCVPECPVAALDRQSNGGARFFPTFRYNDGEETEDEPWQKPTQGAISERQMAAGIAGGEKPEAGRYTPKSNPDGCGSERTAPSLTATRCTTPTSTTPTTTRQTCDSSPSLNMTDCTPGCERTIESSMVLNADGVNPAGNTSQLPNSGHEAPEPMGATASLVRRQSGESGKNRTGNATTLTGEQDSTRRLNGGIPLVPASSAASSSSLTTQPESTAVPNVPVAPLTNATGHRSEPERFFPTFRYQAKCPTSERTLPDGTRVSHVTQKPLALMRWLARLVATPGATVLDPFAGSASTGVACLLEGMRFVGIERDAQYAAEARQRLDAVRPTLDTAQEETA